MTNRERIVTALGGGTPEYTPLTAYEGLCDDKERLAELVRDGLGLTRHVDTWSSYCPAVTFEESTCQRAGHQWRRRLMRTPAGELSELYMDGWPQEFFVKEPADYRVIEYVARNTVQEPRYERFAGAEEEIGEDGIVLVSAGRSPIQDIMVLKVGIEAFCYHLADQVQELFPCWEALAERTIERARIIAGGPGEFVKLWENFTAEPFGPERFARLHMPVWKECGRLLRASGKRLMAHTDGQLARVAPQLNEAGVDILESLTPPSEGDVPPEKWRPLWPDLVFWVNVPVSWYLRPPGDFASRLRQLLERIGSRRGLLLEISEDLPANWSESIPVVLEVLRDSL